MKITEITILQDRKTTISSPLLIRFNKTNQVEMRSVWILKFNYVLVYSSAIFKLTEFSVYTFSF